MTGEEPKSIEQLIDGLRTSDSLAEIHFWQRYGPSLERFARPRVKGAMLARFGPEDIAQSACRTFLRRARLGQYDVPDAGSLWRLLCAIALSKVREQARFHHRRRRSVDDETQLDHRGASDTAVSPGSQVTDLEPAPDEAVAFADQFEKLLSELAPEDREIVAMKLQDRGNQEIAASLRRSERTVRRTLERLRSKFEAAFSDAGQ